MKKRFVLSIALIIVFVIIIIIYSFWYDRYGFLSEINDDHQYSVKISKYDQNGYYSYKGSRLMGSNSQKFHDALKHSRYRYLGKQLSSELDHGEMALIFVRDAKGEAVSNTEFYLYYETQKDRVYLRWHCYLYEIFGFDDGRQVIQETTYKIGIEGIVDDEKNTYFPMTYFSMLDTECVQKYDNHKNIEAITLSSDEDIIEQAKNEVPNGYRNVSLYREEYGDRFLVVFDYVFKDNNIGQRLYVIMDADGITQVVQYRIWHLTYCL